jgi:hypothetical protein
LPFFLFMGFCAWTGPVGRAIEFGGLTFSFVATVLLVWNWGLVGKERDVLRSWRFASQG